MPRAIFRNRKATAILFLFWTFGGAVSVWASTIRVARVEATDTARVTLADGATIDLAESHDEAAIEAATAQFNATAGRHRGRTPTLS